MTNDGIFEARELLGWFLPFKMWSRDRDQFEEWCLAESKRIWEFISTKWPLEKPHLRFDIAVGKIRKQSKTRREHQDGEKAVGTWRKGQSVLSAERVDRRISRLLTNFCIRIVSQEHHMPHNIPKRVRELDPDAYTAMRLETASTHQGRHSEGLWTNSQTLWN